MTRPEFLAFYPQFASFTPGVVLTEYLEQANARFSDFGEDAEEARRLLTAHRLTLYAAVCVPDNTSATMRQLAEAGSTARQAVSAKRAGEVSVTYAETNTAKNIAISLHDLKETVFGLQLLSLLKQYGFAGYIP